MNQKDDFLTKVLNITTKREAKEQEILKYHYDAIMKKIDFAYREYNSFCYYDVDMYIAKLPLYDNIYIASKLNELLVSKGLNSKVFYRNTLLVEWTPKPRPTEHIKIITQDLKNEILAYAEKDDNLVYEVPPSLPGLPWYSVEDTVIEVAKRIAAEGFAVETKGNVIIVSWNIDKLKSKGINVQFTETSSEQKEKFRQDTMKVNEHRYTDFINPKTNPRMTNFNSLEPASITQASLSKGGDGFQTKLDYSKVLENLKKKASRFV